MIDDAHFVEPDNDISRTGAVIDLINTVRCTTSAPLLRRRNRTQLELNQRMSARRCGYAVLIGTTLVGGSRTPEKQEIPILGCLQINNEERSGTKEVARPSTRYILSTYEERAVSPRGSFIIRGRVMSTANADEAVIRYIFQRALSCRFRRRRVLAILFMTGVC